MTASQAGPLQLFELAAADPQVRFSPNCWRIRLALIHKGLECERLDWRFTEKQRIAASGQGKVPVLVDGGRMLHESWDIARHLERSHADRPSLFGPAPGEALARVIVPAIADMVADCDRAYFVQTREATLGASMDELRRLRGESLAALNKVLQPLRSTLGTQDFLCGAQPLYADMVAYSAFQWARICDPQPVLAADDGLRPWLRRMDERFPEAARAPGVRYPF